MRSLKATALNRSLSYGRRATLRGVPPSGALPHARLLLSVHVIIASKALNLRVRSRCAHKSDEHFPLGGKLGVGLTYNTQHSTQTHNIDTCARERLRRYALAAL